MTDVTPYLIIVSVVLLCFLTDSGKRNTHHIIISLFLILGLYELILGILQLLGFFSSLHREFNVTGTFDNPGPYGGFLAIVAIVFYSSSNYFLSTSKNMWKRGRKLAVYLPFTLFVILIILSESRAAFIALMVSFLYVQFKKKSDRCNRRCLTLGITLLFVCTLFTIPCKKDSAMGRLHIWNIECHAIVKHPWGTGSGTFGKTYGDIQKSYFQDKERSERIIRIAGCPEYPFNEYLGIGVEFGILGLLAFVLLIVFCINILISNNSPLGFGLVSFAVFAFFSYPLYIPLTAAFFSCVVGTSLFYFISPVLSPHTTYLLKTSLILLILIGVSHYINHSIDKHYCDEEWKKAKRLLVEGRRCEAISTFESVKDTYRANYIFLFDYGVALSDEGLYEESNRILVHGANISSDPIFHVIIGDNYSKLGRTDLAKNEYMTAYYMVPCRIYPILQLVKLYLSEGDTTKAASVAETALKKPVNKRNPQMQDIHNELQIILQTIK